MELSVSPDLEAFYCYLIVSIVGLFVAYNQVSSRMEGFKDIWRMLGTWILFFLYFFIPVGLYWLLDRTGAIQDTSLFAALIVGFGYERILSGSSGAVQAPGGLSQIWNPLVSYANRIVEKIRDKAHLNDLRMKNQLITEIVAENDRFAALEALGKKLTPDTVTLNDGLAEIDRNTDLGDLAKLERKADILYVEVSATDDFLYEMHQRKIISKNSYLMNAYQIRSKLAALIMLGIFFFVLYLVASKINPLALETEYALWRLEKPNASKIDLFRAERRLALILNGDKEGAKNAFYSLGEKLRKPEFSLERTDHVLNILLEHRCAAVKGEVVLPTIMIKSLNTTDSDARSRIHRALTYLAKFVESKPHPVPSWDPSKGNTVTDLQSHIDEWQVFWEQYPLSSQRSPDCVEI